MGQDRRGLNGCQVGAFTPRAHVRHAPLEFRPKLDERVFRLVHGTHPTLGSPPIPGEPISPNPRGAPTYGGDIEAGQGAVPDRPRQPQAALWDP